MIFLKRKYKEITKEKNFNLPKSSVMSAKCKAVKKRRTGMVNDVSEKKLMK